MSDGHVARLNLHGHDTLASDRVTVAWLSNDQISDKNDEKLNIQLKCPCSLSRFCSMKRLPATPPGWYGS